MTTLPWVSRCNFHRLSMRTTTLSVVCALSLSGCAIWPKALTFWGDSEPATEPETLQTQAPTAPLAPPEEPKADAVSAPVTPVPSADVAPVEKLPPAAAASAPAKPSGPIKMESGYYINVGLFAVPTNASNAFLKLDKAGLPAYTEVLETNVGKLTRVRVGGFPTRAQANAAAKKIHGLQLEAIVFHHK